MNADAGKGHSGGGGGSRWLFIGKVSQIKTLKTCMEVILQIKRSCVTMSDFFLKNHLINITSF